MNGKTDRVIGDRYEKLALGKVQGPSSITAHNSVEVFVVVSFVV